MPPRPSSVIDGDFDFHVFGNADDVIVDVLTMAFGRHLQCDREDGHRRDNPRRLPGHSRPGVERAGRRALVGSVTSDGFTQTERLLWRRLRRIFLAPDARDRDVRH